MKSKINSSDTKESIVVSYNNYKITGTLSGNGILSWGEITKAN